MNVEIAQRLAEIRRKNGLSQENLAEKLGLSRQAISKWERAESSPDTDNLIALAKLYGISLDALLSVEPVLEDDIAFETQDRAREAQGQGRESSPGAIPPGAAPSSFNGPPPPVPPAPQAPPASSASGNQSSYAVDADGCYLDSNGQPYRIKSALRTFPYPLVVVIVFIAGGFAFNWHLSWLIFLTIPFYYWVVKVVEDNLNRPGAAGGAATESILKTVGIVALFVLAMVLILIAATFALPLWQSWLAATV